MKIIITGNYTNLKKNDTIKHKDVMTILDEGRHETVGKYKKPGETEDIFIMKVKTNAGEENMKINKPSLKCLCGAWGDETGDWVGKQIRLWKTPSQKDGEYYFIATPVDWSRDDEMQWVIPEVNRMDDIN